MSKKVNELTLDYCRNTTAHGISHIVTSSHAVKKVGWILILCGVLGGSSYHIYALISSYLEYNYYTSVTLDTGKPLVVIISNYIFKLFVSQ